jgi:hypothetical protein
MDVVAEYAERYGAPSRETTWHEIIALVKRTGRFELRDRLIQADGVILGKPSTAPTDMLLRAKYERLAWPMES